jgi:feruloyl esterase
MSRMYDATSPDLTPLCARGGKLLMYHGWADPIVTPQ